MWGNAHTQGDAAEALGRLAGADEIPLLVKLLDDPDMVTRIQAASWLCRLGSKAGTALLEEEGPLIPLNALRQPEAWKRLEGWRLSRDIRGKAGDLLREFARQAGLELELPPAPLPERNYDSVSRASVEWYRLADALPDVLPGHWEAVLEGNRLRVLERREALKSWRSWRDEELRKQPVRPGP